MEQVQQNKWRGFREFRYDVTVALLGFFERGKRVVFWSIAGLVGLFLSAMVFGVTIGFTESLVGLARPASWTWLGLATQGVVVVLGTQIGLAVTLPALSKLLGLELSQRETFKLCFWLVFSVWAFFSFADPVADFINSAFFRPGV